MQTPITSGPKNGEHLKFHAPLSDSHPPHLSEDLAPSEPEAIGKHAEAVLASRIKMQPEPNGYRGVKQFPQVGIRVTRGIKGNLGKAGIQFSNDRPLSRETEYDLMTKIQEAGFQFQPHSRQWVRPLPEGKTPFENVMDASDVADEIATERQGRGR